MKLVALQRLARRKLAQMKEEDPIMRARIPGNLRFVLTRGENSHTYNAEVLARYFDSSKNLRDPLTRTPLSSVELSRLARVCARSEKYKFKALDQVNDQLRSIFTGIFQSEVESFARQLLQLEMDVDKLMDFLGSSYVSQTLLLCKVAAPTAFFGVFDQIAAAAASGPGRTFCALMCQLFESIASAVGEDTHEMVFSFDKETSTSQRVFVHLRALGDGEHTSFHEWGAIVDVKQMPHFGLLLNVNDQE